MGKAVNSKRVENGAGNQAVAGTADHDRPINGGCECIKPREGIVNGKPIADAAEGGDGIEDIEQDGNADGHTNCAKWRISANA